MIGTGSTTTPLTESDARQILAQGLERVALDNQRVLVIIPDNTRTAPTPLLFRLLYEQLGARVARLDYLIALGTHPPMTDDAIAKLVGVTKAERAARYPKSEVFNPFLERAARADDARHDYARGT
jgi:nickel-dependent lactate racemase